MDNLLQYDTYGPPPASMREQLILYTDGTLVRQVASASDPERQDRIGTWRANLDPDRLADAEKIAAGLSGFSAPALHPQRGAPHRTLALGADASGPKFPLITEEPLPPPLSAADGLRVELQNIVGAGPLAVLQLETILQRSGGKIKLVFTFFNPGTEAIEFLLDAQAFTLHSDPGGAAVWQNPGRPLVGLVAGDGSLIDGIGVPASLSAGARASIVFPISSDDRLPAEGLTASTGGAVSLVVPGEQPPPYPETRFRLRASTTGPATAR